MAYYPQTHALFFRSAAPSVRIVSTWKGALVNGHATQSRHSGGNASHWLWLATGCRGVIHTFCYLAYCSPLLSKDGQAEAWSGYLFNIVWPHVVRAAVLYTYAVLKKKTETLKMLLQQYLPYLSSRAHILRNVSSWNAALYAALRHKL
eukprot:9308287-Pyramimonas_sp.AAC.1